MSDNRCAHAVMWGDRTDVVGRNGVPRCPQCAGVPRCYFHPDRLALSVTVALVEGIPTPLGACYACEYERDSRRYDKGFSIFR